MVFIEIPSLIYRKGIKDDLTPKEKMVLRKINVEW